LEGSWNDLPFKKWVVSVSKTPLWAGLKKLMISWTNSLKISVSKTDVFTPRE